MSQTQSKAESIRIHDMMLKDQESTFDQDQDITDVMHAIPKDLQDFASRLYGAVEGAQDESAPATGAKVPQPLGDGLLTLQRAARFKRTR